MMKSEDVHWLEEVKVKRVAQTTITRLCQCRFSFQKILKKKAFCCLSDAWPCPASVTVTNCEHDWESIELFDSIANRNDIFQLRQGLQLHRFCWLKWWLSYMRRLIEQ